MRHERGGRQEALFRVKKVEEMGYSKRGSVMFLTQNNTALSLKLGKAFRHVLCSASKINCLQEGVDIPSCSLQPILFARKISPSYNLTCPDSEEEQYSDHPVRIQLQAVIWQPFLACSLSALLTPGHWVQPDRLTSPLLLHDPVTCWKGLTSQKTAGCYVAVGLFGLSRINRAGYKLLPVAVVVKFVVTGKCNEHPKACS